MGYPSEKQIKAIKQINAKKRQIIATHKVILKLKKENERDYTHFYLAVRSIVFKLTKGNAPDTAQMNARVR